jgi:hypothetical protein
MSKAAALPTLPAPITVIIQIKHDLNVEYN